MERRNKQVTDLMPELVAAAFGGSQARYGAVSSEELLPLSPDIKAVQEKLDELDSKIKTLHAVHNTARQYGSADEARKTQQKIAALKGEIEIFMHGMRKNLDAVRRSKDYSTHTMYGVFSRRLEVAERTYEQEIARFDHERQQIQEMLDDVPAPRIQMQVGSYEDARERERAEEIRQRDEGVKQLEMSIQDLAEITKDLAEMVHEQGPMLDRIETNVTSTETHTAAAAVELRQARRHQSSARKTKMCVCALLLVILVIMVLLVTLVKPSKH